MILFDCKGENMLNVQSINLTKQPGFTSGNGYGSRVTDVGYEPVESFNDEDYFYSKDEYSKDKTNLERQLDEINAVIENVDVPKPIRTFGKIVSVGIGSALGFVSMKYGAQGVAKIIRKGVNYAKAGLNKSSVKNIGTKVGNVIDQVKDSALVKELSTKTNSIKARYANSKIGTLVSSLISGFKENKIVKNISSKISNLKQKVMKYMTVQNAENGAVNLFAVSGGVTGGVTALQEVSKGQ